MKRSLYLCAVSLVALIALGLGLPRTHAATGEHVVYLPMVARSGGPPATTQPTVTAAPPMVTVTPPTVTAAPPTVTATPPTVTATPPTVTVTPPTVTATPPTVTPVPSLAPELVGTWYSGKLLNGQFYDPNTRTWQDPGGIAHMYAFEANGSYRLASYLKLQTGSFCVSQVWKYHTGTVRAEGADLLLTPSYARTRTRIDCGSHTDTETEGPYTTTTVPWLLVEDEYGRTRLRLSEVQGTTDYYKDGLAEQIMGTWRLGEVHAAGFYDRATGEWAMPAGPGEWYEFNADGTYRYGAFLTRYVSDDCDLAILVYQEGQLSGSGSTITTRATTGARRTVNLCDPDQVTDEDWVDPKLGDFAWSLLNRDTTPTLRLLRIMPFESRSFIRDE